MNDDGNGFAPPPFNPGEALQRARRELRELGLTERDGRFERRGMVIARLAVDGDWLQAAVVRRPSRGSPEWLPRRLASSAELRDFIIGLKRQLAAWAGDDD